MPPQNDEHETIKVLVEQNQLLITENNELIKKMHRQMVWGFWIRVLWYVVLIGLPFALYFYVLEPYFEALGSSYDTFSAGIQEIPGWKQLHEMFSAAFSKGGVE